MNICLIGDGLICLSLAKTLINNKFKVSMYYGSNKKISSDNRTIGISTNNLEFFEKEIVKINKKLFWKIKEIDIYREDNRNSKILNFKDQKKTLFSIIKNRNLYDLINNSLKKNKSFKKILIKNKTFYNKIFLENKYDLIINCDGKNEISKKYFYRKILKNYNSTAYVTLIKHKKVNNKNATQIFTRLGPIAFLPISETQTSIVYSIKNNDQKKLSQQNFEKLLDINNNKYKIVSVNKIETFNLSSKILRNYYYKNVLAFGDMLHQIHPLSGQGFNMSVRDIKILLELLKNRQSLGLPIDSSIYKEFEKNTKHLNFLFSHGNDFIYEFFNYNNSYLKPFSSKLLYYLKNKNLLNDLAIKYADKGLLI
tara:strand:- start:3455 stop:4555 length:1101 start_codon:yes stop_codon:yes gene_type:complete